MTQLQVKAVSISEKKGTIKKPVDQIQLTSTGVEHDAHAGNWNRQVSLLGIESINRFAKSMGRPIGFGEFAENITTEGLELAQTKPLDTFHAGETILEVTQIGKKCHGTNCAIFKETGDCVMPKEGLFCRVIQGGTLKAGDTLLYNPKVFKVTVITLSDRAHEGIYPDKSGPEIAKLVEEFFKSSGRECEITSHILPDDSGQLSELVKSTKQTSDIIFTTGGTGIGPKDITVETIRPFITKEIPGIMEFIRLKYAESYPASLLSRGIAGVSDKVLLFTLPGSPKAVKEYLTEIFTVLMHAIYMIHQIDHHH